jgi:hypothetical protein
LANDTSVRSIHHDQPVVESPWTSVGEIEVPLVVKAGAGSAIAWVRQGPRGKGPGGSRGEVTGEVNRGGGRLGASYGATRDGTGEQQCCEVLPVPGLEPEVAHRPGKQEERPAQRQEAKGVPGQDHHYILPTHALRDRAQHPANQHQQRDKRAALGK